ncbi:MAG: hypothetical protein AAFR67_00360 [Chloroflexota bacterium]
MFGSGISFEALQECLASVEPVDLQGMRLLKACPPTIGLFPQNVPCATIKEAVIELVQYTERCNSTARRLRNLSPIPLLTIQQIEYGL